MALLDEPDARWWEQLGGRVAFQVEQRLTPCVLGNRTVGRPSGWSLQPLAPALSRARRLAAQIAAASEAVLRTDVAAFYPSIVPGTLYRVLRSASADRGDAGAAADLLEGWGSHGYPGLPIGPPASAVMANAVLRTVDRALADLAFVRWVDDYLIGLPHPALTPAVLERIDEALARLRLRRSADKTAVVPGHRPLRWLGMSPTA